MSYIIITKKQIRMAVVSVIVFIIIFFLGWLGEKLRPDCCSIEQGYYHRGMILDQHISCLFFNKADSESRIVARIGLAVFIILIFVFTCGPGEDEKGNKE